MSAISPVPSPLHLPQPPAAKPAPAGPPASSRKWWMAGVLFLVLGAVAAFYALRPADTVAPVAAVPTEKVGTGTLVSTLRVAGTTSAREYENVSAPLTRGPEAGRPMVLEKLAASGSMVTKGTLIAQIEATAAKDHIDDVVPLVNQAKLDIERRKAEQAVDMETLNQQLRIAKSDLDKAKLDLSAGEIRASIDQEILKLSVEESAARYKELQTDLAQKKLVHAAELRILAITQLRQEMHLERHMSDYRKFRIAAKMNGLVVLQSIFRGGEMAQITEGDTVGPGQGFMKVVNPNSMQVDATVNQTESSHLRVGQEAQITLDAFPGLVLKGKVYSIGALASGGWRQQYYIRSIPVRLAIEGADPRVIPDLSAAGDVVIGKADNATLAPLAAIETVDNKTFAYVRRGASFERQAVELGGRNNLQTEVVSGLKSGDEVRLIR
ncbi:MAG: HlyD family efflux transporter periplasmic adaptor subunit [Bryobacteraceae bacterium]